MDDLWCVWFGWGRLDRTGTWTGTETFRNKYDSIVIFLSFTLRWGISIFTRPGNKEGHPSSSTYPASLRIAVPGPGNNPQEVAEWLACILVLKLLK